MSNLSTAYLAATAFDADNIELEVDGLNADGETIMMLAELVKYGMSAENTRTLPLREAVAKVLEAHTDQLSWLKRMAELSWDDSTYAPKFKRSIAESEQALANLLKLLDGAK